jgi:hypothetical protein
MDDMMIIKDDPTYYAIKGRLSASGLKFLNTHPKAYQDYINNGVESTIHIEKGKLIHALLLEPGTVKSLYTYLPAKDLPEPDKGYRSKKNREYRDKFIEDNKDKTVFDKEDEYQSIIKMTNGVHKNKNIKRLIDGCEIETGFTWTNFETGVAMKGKTDGFKSKKNGRSYILDVKKLPDISPKKIRQYIIDRFIHSQLGVYADGLREHGLCDPDDYYILALCDATSDYGVYRINDFIDDGYSEFLRLATLYKKCFDTDTWPGLEMYGDDKGIIDLTNYGKKEYAI